MFNNDVTDPLLLLKRAGLTIDVNSDFTYRFYEENITSDGYHIYIDQISTYFNVPVHVPSNMDVSITLAQPKKILESTQCRSIDHLPEMKYFDYYDSDGVHCIFEAFLTLAEKYFGCSLPVLSYMPVNGCAFEQFFLYDVLLSDSGVDELLKSFKGLGKGQSEGFNLLQSLFSKNSPCKRVCSRWSYPVLSASYGSIEYRDRFERKRRQSSNRSWSRIKIILPDSFRIHREKPKASMYLAMCDIGGMMGVYAGFSMVTFVQIVAYGFNIVRSIRKRRRKVDVAPVKSTLIDMISDEMTRNQRLKIFESKV